MTVKEKIALENAVNSLAETAKTVRETVKKHLKEEQEIVDDSGEEVDTDSAENNVLTLTEVEEHLDDVISKLEDDIDVSLLETTE